MKKILALIIISFSLISLGGVSEKFLEALIIQESSGRDFVIGDNGKAVGCLQIHKEIVDEVNKKCKKNYKYSDRTNRKKSKEICRLYLGIYATEKRLGRKPTNKDYARIWNGGPNGHKRTATISYWNKLKKNNPNL